MGEREGRWRAEWRWPQLVVYQVAEQPVGLFGMRVARNQYGPSGRAATIGAALVTRRHCVSLVWARPVAPAEQQQRRKGWLGGNG